MQIKLLILGIASTKFNPYPLQNEVTICKLRLINQEVDNYKTLATFWDGQLKQKLAFFVDYAG